MCYNNTLKYKAMEGPILSKERIALKLIIVYSPWQNRVVERLNKTLVIIAKSML
jgi:predicted membrane-bound dolichyl-phosphate-mannose-protein mannosyltransferase